MKERPILFSTPMVRAILDEGKTVTRRIMKLQKHTDLYPCVTSKQYWSIEPEKLNALYYKCPYGGIDDRLWVRETSLIWGAVEDVVYTTDKIYEHCKRDMISLRKAGFPKDGVGNWKVVPSIFMPRDASRITLKIIDIKVERLQDITDVEAIDEGVLSLDEAWVERQYPEYFKSKTEWMQAGSVGRPPLGPSPRERFEKLWQSINGPESWNLNPWVWVIKFHRIKV